MRTAAVLLLVCLVPLLVGWDGAWERLLATPHECDHRPDLLVFGVLTQHRCGTIALGPHDARALAERAVALEPRAVWVEAGWSTDGISVWRSFTLHGLRVRVTLTFITWHLTGARVTAYGPALGGE
jgi:hypothetical protein